MTKVGTYLDELRGSLLLLFVEFLSGVFISWILQVRTEKTQVLLLFRGIIHLQTVKLCVFSRDFLFNQTRVPDSDVVIGTPWNLLA